MYIYYQLLQEHITYNSNSFLRSYNSMVVISPDFANSFFASSTACASSTAFSLLRNFFSSIPLSTLLHVHLCLRSTPSFSGTPGKNGKNRWTVQSHRAVVILHVLQFQLLFKFITFKSNFRCSAVETIESSGQLSVSSVV